MLRKRQSGVSMVETLVAVVVVSIGLLGVSLLLNVSVQQSVSASDHTQAVWHAYSLADRARINTAGFEDYIDIDTNEDYSQSCTADACTPAQMAVADASEWAAAIQALPLGRGLVTGDATQLNITVLWDSEGTGATGTGCSGNSAVDLTCYSIVVLR